MDSDSTSKVEVIVTAIDGDYLVLETIADKIKIKWPLKNIPRPLEIGSQITLELQKNEMKIPDGMPENISNIPKGQSEEKMRKLLEDLVN